MKVVVFGANGKVGSLVVSKLLGRGHEVTAFIHGSNQLHENPHLKITQGDVYDPEAVMKSVIGQDAVISCLGSWGTPRKDILTRGMQSIIPAMQTAGVHRIVSLTGADAVAGGDHNNILRRANHWILGKIAPKILKDGEDHIVLLSKSDLHWVVVRSPVMNNRGSSEFNLGKKRPLPWQTINRNSVAEAILTCITTDTFNQSAPYITRK